MTTRQQDKEFADLLSDENWLDRAIDWIAANLNPGDVFSDEQLSERAINNDFIAPGSE